MHWKQSCYFVNQDFFTTCSEEELTMLDTKCKEGEDLAKSRGDSVKQKEAKLRSLTGSLPDTGQPGQGGAEQSADGQAGQVGE